METKRLHHDRVSPKSINSARGSTFLGHTTPESGRATAHAFLTVGLLSAPVKLYKATDASNGSSFNMVHRGCATGIQQKIHCPKCGNDVSRSERHAPGSNSLGKDAELLE